MMAWNAYVLLGAIVGALLAGMHVQDCIRSNKRPWLPSLWILAAIGVLAWVEGRYAVAAPNAG